MQPKHLRAKVGAVTDVRLPTARGLVIALFIAAVAASPALADAPVATAGAAQAPPPEPQAAAPPLAAAPANAPAGPPVAMGPCGPKQVKPDGTLETKPHGEIDAGAGTAGYRHIAGEVCQPLKNGGAVDLGVSYDQFGWRGR
jgi:hypothetical protein